MHPLHERLTERLPEGLELASNVVSTEEVAIQAPEAIRLRCVAMGIEYLDKAPDFSPDAVALIDADRAVRLGIVPLQIESRYLLVAMEDPFQLASVDEVAGVVRRPVKRVGLTRGAFRDLLRRAYGTTAARMAESLGGQEDAAEEAEHNLDAIEADDIHRMAEQPTLINLVNLLLLEAIQTRASDVHIEPFESELKVKYRIDGVLIEQPPPPKQLQAAIIGRIKIMAHMNIAERYVPQDGHIALRFEGRKVDIRVSTVPTIYGESIVMRILDKSNLSLDLRSLGMSDTHRRAMDRLVEKPHGLLLVTGPTGSGKTTTLYAALSQLYDPRKKIITIEDPVEYELNGINQIPVNPKRGLTFATGLRAILRQDPDVILVGEIRDRETVDIAIRSALTGHLILSTLHTNDALSSTGRLIDMGAEPYLVASVLEGLLAQRLGRRICSHCRVQAPLGEDLSVRIRPDERELFVNGGFAGAGCEECKGSGFRNRVGFYELVRMSAALRAAVSESKTPAELRRVVGDDFVSMRQDGMLKAAHGITTVTEVLRATQDLDEG
ncbi:MAG: GspE/PulE family protein [Planctomycetota bacterium]|nr:GspE/PulE family protein [Planctomycetota bacterium]